MRLRVLHVRVILIILLIMGALPWMIQAGPQNVVEAATSDLLISEYVEGSSYNKGIEIYNGTGADLDMSAGNYVLALYSNGYTSVTASVSLTATIADGDVYVVAHGSAAFAGMADLTNNSVINFNGNDAVVLWKDGLGVTAVDSIGQVGNDTTWGANMTLRRQETICSGDTIVNDAFSTATEWDSYPSNTSDGLGSHTASCGESAPEISSTTPSDGAGGVAVDANVEITFSEAVTLTGTWYDITCDTSGAHNSGSVTDADPTFTINPDTDFTPGESCTVTVYAAQVTDDDTDDPPNAMEADDSFIFSVASGDPCADAFTPIYTIQGSGAASSYDGTSDVVTMGVVTSDLQTSGRAGFYIQDVTGDADPATSDGIFVYATTPDVNVGEIWRLTGTVDEYYGMTQLESITGSLQCGTGTISPTTVTLPVPAGTTYAEFWEQYESMLVQLTDTLTVTDNYELGQYGQFALSQGGRLLAYTQNNAPDVAGYAAFETDTDNEALRRTIIVDDYQDGANNDPIVWPPPELTATNSLRLGTEITNLTGVVHYTFNDFVINPVGTVPFSFVNPRTPTPDPVGGTLTVASYNVLNYFTTLGMRGANTATEFTRQHDKIVAALAAIDADVVGLLEIENDATYTVDFLLNGDGTHNGLNDVLGGTRVYSYVNTGVVGTDEIKVALIYDTLTTSLNGPYAILDSSVDPNFIDTKNRPVLAQTFTEIASGESVIVAINHLKSKGSDCNDVSDPDLLDGAGNCNLTRLSAVQAEINWLAGDPTGTGETDYLILGDMNSFYMEDPVQAFLSAGYANQGGGPTAYSKLYYAKSATYDYAFSSTTLTPQVAGATIWHISSDEPHVLDYNEEYKTTTQQIKYYNVDPYAASDHDPVVVGLALSPAAVPGYGSAPTPGSTISLSTVVGTPTNESVVINETGNDTLTINSYGVTTGVEITVSGPAAPFDITDGASSETLTVTCDSGTPGNYSDTLIVNHNAAGSPATYIIECEVTPQPSALVINEVDYDQDGTDEAEFIELYNPSADTINLDPFAVIAINGNGTTVYQTFDLPDVDLAAGGYYVICANAITVDNCDLDVSPDTNLLQNGSPDAVALTSGGFVIDTVSYEGDTGAPYTETAGVGFIDNNTDVNFGISRWTNGTDTDNNSADFIGSCITPGAANTNQSAPCNESAVNVTDDTDDGVCDAGHCSLREAINAVNQGASETISFTVSLPGTITLTNGLPAIRNDVTITGPGESQLTIQGTNADPIFMVPRGVTVNISEMTLTNGAGTMGGAIRNRGTLVITNVTLSDNDTSRYGGALYNYPGASLTLSGVTVHNNSAAYGGGIFNAGTLLIDTASALTDNTAATGGGIYNLGSLTVQGSTLDSNGATGAGGGIYNAGGTVNVTTTVFHANLGSDGGALYSATGGAADSVTASCIITNDDNAVADNGGANVTATGNWWGAADGPGGPGGTGSGDTISLGVNASGFLTSGILGCGLDGSYAPVSGQLVEAEDVEVLRVGTWQVQSAREASNGSYVISSGNLEDNLQLAFTGSTLNISIVMGPGLGTLGVAVDGIELQTINTQWESQRYNVQVTFTNLGDNSHTVRVYPVNGVIAVDAFLVPALPEVTPGGPSISVSPQIGDTPDDLDGPTSFR